MATLLQSLQGTRSHRSIRRAKDYANNPVLSVSPDDWENELICANLWWQQATCLLLEGLLPTVTERTAEVSNPWTNMRTKWTYFCFKRWFGDERGRALFTPHIVNNIIFLPYSGRLLRECSCLQPHGHSVGLCHLTLRATTGKYLARSGGSWLHRWTALSCLIRWSFSLVKKARTFIPKTIIFASSSPPSDVCI